jgi:DNA polymerase-1
LADFQETITVTQLKLQRLTRNKDFNPNSPAQIKAAYKNLGLLLETSEADQLRHLAVTHKNKYIVELSTLLLSYKQATSGSKYLTQYKHHAVGPNTNIPIALYPFDSDATPRLHPSYRPNGTATTRYSCGEPNVQNVAGKDIDDPEEKLPLRKVFGPAPGRLWYAYDYSQLQLRIFAYEANDKAIIELLAQGHDFHEIVARRLFNIPPDQPVPKAQRRDAKSINFGLIFGMGRAKLAAQTGKPELYDLFRHQFPALDRTMSEAQRQVRSYGYVTTRFGYRLYPYGGAAHKALNFIVQGGEGDIMKNSMIAVHKYLTTLIPKHKKVASDTKPAYITLTVHDELVIDCPTSWSITNVRHVQTLMEQAGLDLGFHTPVSVSKITDNWGQAEDVVLSSTV